MPKKRTRTFKRMHKSDRQNQKLWAEGVRELILAPHVAPYADALARSHVAERDYVCRVQHEYHQLIPWDLPDDEEPPLPLPAYDPNQIPSDEILSAEECIRKSKCIAKKNKVSCLMHSINALFLTRLIITGNSSLAEIPCN